MVGIIAKPQVIKSVMSSDKEVLQAVLELYKPLNMHGVVGFDLDPCFSTGKFYEDLPHPLIKLDKEPKLPDVRQNDLMSGLPFGDDEFGGIVFDPPFMFGTHGQTKNNLMNKRFTMFDSWEQLENMYLKALHEFYRVLRNGGIVAFKCQDYTDSRTTLTHCHVYNWAEQIGFRVEDIFIMVFKGGRIWNSNLVQRHARKYHSYWLILRKGRTK